MTVPGPSRSEEPARAPSEEVTRNLRVGRDRPPAAEEPTRDLRRPRSSGPKVPPGPGPWRPPPPPAAPPRRSTGRMVLIAVGVLVGLVFLGVAAVGLYALVGTGGGGAQAAELSVGDCVTVSGDGGSVGVDPADCGSRAANYAVVAKGASADDCPQDVDDSFTQTATGGSDTTICLDIDWARGDCFELSGSYPERVDCTAAPGRHTVRVVEVDRTTSETAHCPSGSGLPYPQRRFVVCLDHL